MITVKICGISNLEDARVAADAGADLLGFICYAKSPRFVEPSTIRSIVRGVRAEANARRQLSGELRRSPRVPRFVGVFVDAPVADVRHVMDTCGLDYAQLHGDEPVDDIPALSGRAYKAIRLAISSRSETDAALFAPLVRHHGPHLLVDAWTPGAYGGTGQRADWDQAARLASKWSHLLLAGGLSPDNVESAIRAIRPWGVDVSSGVEISPGRKDHEAVREFIHLAKETK